jgi:hypothetical protein
MQSQIHRNAPQPQAAGADEEAIARSWDVAFGLTTPPTDQVHTPKSGPPGVRSAAAQGDTIQQSWDAAFVAASCTGGAHGS